MNAFGVFGADVALDLAISIVITTLRGIKGPEKKATCKKVFLKVNTLIRGVYGDDEDFTNVWK